MKFEVDLSVCRDHLQCVFAAPDDFAADGELLAFRRVADERYISGEVPPRRVDDVETAADMCPVQAISLLDVP